MNYYQFHIGDFRSGTINMSRKARWIYRDMIDAYYDTEQPLPSDMDVLCDMLGIEDPEERVIVERHLRFKFELVDGAYRHSVCDSVIAEYHSKADVARANGKKGGRPRNNPIETQNNPAGFENNPVATVLKTNQEPLTINQEPEEIKSVSDQQAESPKKEKARRSTKIPDPFLLTAEMRAWATEHAPALNIRDETENFVDYWRGAGKAKADWVATWRTWMRKNQKDAVRGTGYRPINRQQQIEDANQAVVLEIAERERLRRLAEQGKMPQQDDFISTGDIIIEGEYIHAK